MDEKRLLELEDSLGKAGWAMRGLIKGLEGPEKMMLAYAFALVGDSYKLVKEELAHLRETERG